MLLLVVTGEQTALSFAAVVVHLYRTQVEREKRTWVLNRRIGMISDCHRLLDRWVGHCPRPQRTVAVTGNLNRPRRPNRGKSFQLPARFRRQR